MRCSAELLECYRFLDSAEAVGFWQAFQRHSEQRRVPALRKKFSASVVAAGESLAQLRKKAENKGFLAKKLWWTAKSLQQASSIWTAKYHAKLAESSQTVVDLCCGAGGELAFLGLGPSTVIAVDNDACILELAKHNAAIFGRENVDFRYQNAEDFGGLADFIFLDPDRRRGGKRILDPADYSPSALEWKKILAKSRVLCVKISPLADFFSVAQMLNAEIHFLSVKNEMKEILLIAGESAVPFKRVAVDCSTGAQFSVDDFDNKPLVLAGSLKRFLLEPNPALVVSGLLKAYAQQHGQMFLDSQSPYLVSDELDNGDWLRCYRIDDSFPFRQRSLQKDLEARQIGQAIFKKKGFAVPIQQFEQMKLRGNRKAVVFFTLFQKRRRVILCDVSDVG